MLTVRCWLTAEYWQSEVMALRGGIVAGPFSFPNEFTGAPLEMS